MANKKFNVFKVASILALVIALAAFTFLFFFIFSEKIINISSSSDMIYVVVLFFLLLAGILFQVQNIWLVNYIKKEELPWPHFIKYHTVLLIFNAFSTVGIGIILYSLILELYDNGFNQKAASVIIFWFCAIWFCANLISIIGSLHIRTYLRILQIRKEKAALRNFGENLVD